MLLFWSDRDDLPDGSGSFVVRGIAAVLEKLLDCNSALLWNRSDRFLHHLLVFGWRQVCGSILMLLLQFSLSSEFGICSPIILESVYFFMMFDSPSSYESFAWRWWVTQDSRDNTEEPFNLPKPLIFVIPLEADTKNLDATVSVLDRFVPSQKPFFIDFASV